MELTSTGFQFFWTGVDGVERKYRADLPDVNGTLRLPDPDGTVLMIRGCRPFTPTGSELVAINDLSGLTRAELIR